MILSASPIGCSCLYCQMRASSHNAHTIILAVNIRTTRTKGRDTMQRGAVVQRIHPSDGSALAGTPSGPRLGIREIRHHAYWISCMNGIEHYYVLSDGS